MVKNAGIKRGLSHMSEGKPFLVKGDLVQAVTTASAAYAASALHAASDAVCQRIKKQAGSLIESMGKKQSSSQTVLTFH